MSVALFGTGIKYWKFDLLVIGIQIDEQPVDFIEHFFNPCIGAVDLIDADHDLKLGCQGLSEYKSCLRKWTLCSINQKQYAFDHAQDPLNFGTKVGVAGGVDNVDLNVVPFHACRLRQNGDPALSFEVHRVHDPVGYLLVGLKCSTLTEHMVHKCGFSVVNVSHDGDNRGATDGRIIFDVLFRLNHMSRFVEGGVDNFVLKLLSEQLGCVQVEHIVCGGHLAHADELFDQDAGFRAHAMGKGSDGDRSVDFYAAFDGLRLWAGLFGARVLTATAAVCGWDVIHIHLDPGTSF